VVRRTWEDINAKIESGDVVVITAEEMTALTAKVGTEKAFERVDVVTTGTFGPMCGSGLLLNTGHARPRINYSSATLNGVPAYAGLAAVDLYLGATSRSTTAPRYGGGHVIEELVSGGSVSLRALGHGTDCYPAGSLSREVCLEELGDALLLNPRNCYQNYNVAVNATSPRTIRTYMGPLLPRMANVAYSSAGALSPLLNDPEYRTIGIGSRIFLGGGIGYVAFHGTQHAPDGRRSDEGIPLGGAGTVALVGDLHGMSPDYLRGLWIEGYGASLAVGVGMAIPMLDIDLARQAGLSESSLTAPVVDYSSAYPDLSNEVIGRVSYAELRSGQVMLAGARRRTMPLSSFFMARRIAVELKNRIEAGSFLLSRPVDPLPGAAV
jgi:uncharacterized protein (DUF39 family)